MFIIQYEAINGEHKMQDFDSKSRTLLLTHLARFSRPIVAVYSNGSVITKAIRKDLKTWPPNLNCHAKEFINSRL